MRYMYKHKKTGQTKVTGEKLKGKDWKKTGEWRTGQMQGKRIKQK